MPNLSSLCVFFSLELRSENDRRDDENPSRAMISNDHAKICYAISCALYSGAFVLFVFWLHLSGAHTFNIIHVIMRPSSSELMLLQYIHWLTSQSCVINPLWPTSIIFPYSLLQSTVRWRWCGECLYGRMYEEKRLWRAHSFIPSQLCFSCSARRSSSDPKKWRCRRRSVCCASKTHFVFSVLFVYINSVESIASEQYWLQEISFVYRFQDLTKV